jgi:hypothetical protein
MLVYEIRKCTKMLMPLEVIVSSHNSLGNGRYYDVESSSSFAFDHTTQACLIGFYNSQGLTENRKQVEFGVIFWKAVNQILCRTNILQFPQANTVLQKISLEELGFARQGALS